MEVRKFVYEDDYPMLCEWYAGWNMHPVPVEILPKNGLILRNGGHDVCAAFLYLTDGRVGLFEGAILNPRAPKEARIGAQAALHKAMQELAKELGCVQAWVICKDKPLKKISEDQGFWCYPNQFNVLIKGL